MLEMARYAMATGESIFFGAARVFKPLMWFFFVAAITDLHLARPPVGRRGRVRGDLTGIPGRSRRRVALIFVGVLFSLAQGHLQLPREAPRPADRPPGRRHRRHRRDRRQLGDLGDTVTGMFAFGYFPDRHCPRPGSRSWSARSRSPGRPACSRCGTRCNCVTAVPAWVRTSRRSRGLAHAKVSDAVDAVAGLHVRHRGPRGDGEVEGLAQVGHVRRASLLFWGITMLVTVSFTVLALSAAENPGRAGADPGR